MPTIVGIVADKYVQPQRMLGICHLLAGLGMVGLFYLGMTDAQPDKTTFIAIYSLSVAFYMPTLALSNTTAFAILKGKGYDTVTDFPPMHGGIAQAEEAESYHPCKHSDKHYDLDAITAQEERDHKNAKSLRHL